MSAVAEEKFGSSSVQRNSVPAGTTMLLCALLLAAANRNANETIRQRKNRRMCCLPCLQAGQHKTKPRGTELKRAKEARIPLPGPTQLRSGIFLPKCRRKLLLREV